MTRTLTTHNAEISTVAVTIKTLTVEGRQVTMAVFRQLLDISIVDNETMKFRGVGWGHVRYKIDAHHEDAINLVWQEGEFLRRCVVHKELPKAKLPDPMIYSGYPRGTDRLVYDCHGIQPVRYVEGFVWKWARPLPIMKPDNIYVDTVAEAWGQALIDHRWACDRALKKSLSDYEAHCAAHAKLVSPLFDLPQLFIAV